MTYKSICYRCSGGGRIQSLNHPWWMFWKEMKCPVCDGTGIIEDEMTREEALDYVINKIRDIEGKIRRYES